MIENYVLSEKFANFYNHFCRPNLISSYFFLTSKQTRGQHHQAQAIHHHVVADIIMMIPTIILEIQILERDHVRQAHHNAMFIDMMVTNSLK